MYSVRFAALLLLLPTVTINVMGQQIRITRPIDNRQRVTMRGQLHPQARSEFDQGRVAPSLALNYVTLTLAQTESQNTDLDQLLSEQQTRDSANYHRWLTPEEYAGRFGVNEDDLNKITAWLQTHGLSIAAVGRGRNWIAVSGTAAQIESAFQTELHHYLVNGELHFANSAEPSLPEAFDRMVTGIHGLHDFRLKPSRRPRIQPDYTSARGNHYLAPNDLATIYNIKSLYAAGIDGSGQKLVVAGQTQINLSDLQQFRSSFNLPASDPKVVLVPDSTDPGIVQDDLAEADLDLEWAGAVARNAAIIYVYASDVLSAVQYAIDQNLAPVVSLSYGLCELESSTSDALTLRSWARQANVQGITWFAASGDSGGADCGDSQNPGFAVDMPASIPEVTGVGGTTFNEGAGQFWNSSNDGNGASVLSYIPEATWNDSVLVGDPSASGGGASIFFSKPFWQTGPGVPSDTARHVPDVALNASAEHDGYLVYTGGNLGVYGGTSVPTPSFAGIAVLLNQYQVSHGTQSSAGLGNINPGLYSLAHTTSDVFHDITTGDNIVTVTCSPRARFCSSTPVGFSAGTGYDQATGLGSVDAYKLVTEWNAATSTPPSTTALTLLTNLTKVATTDVMYLIATVSGSNGNTPAGTVTFRANGSALGTAVLVGSAGTATATLVVSGAQLPLGTGTITATYSGPSNSTSASVTVSVTGSGSGSSGTPGISALANAASYRQSFAPGGILALFGSQLAPSTQAAGSVPLPISMSGVAVLVNGVAAPLYYVAPGQLNIQIPYETVPNSTAVLSVNNNGKVSSQSFSVAATAPGIFMDASTAIVPAGSAARGQQIALYLTGAGAVSPAVSTGTAPLASTGLADLPRPVQNTTVTVGNAQATITFLGVPPGLVGVTQINFVVPSGLAAGAQPVVVTVGGVPSAATKLTITN